MVLRGNNILIPAILTGFVALFGALAGFGTFVISIRYLFVFLAFLAGFLSVISLELLEDKESETIRTEQTQMDVYKKGVRDGFDIAVDTISKHGNMEIEETQEKDIIYRISGERSSISQESDEQESEVVNKSAAKGDEDTAEFEK